MKYAFILGSNAFLVSKPVISFTENGETRDLIKLNRTYEPHKTGADSFLDVDTDVALPHKGAGLKLKNNSANGSAVGYHVKESDRQVMVLGGDEHIILDVHQLDADAIRGLSSHVINELDWHEPYIAIRVRGAFSVGDHEIEIDNEKVFIDNESYAETVHVGNDGVVFSPQGIRP
jgi:hypothetical protein